MFCVPSVGTNFHKQNSAFLGFYESGSRRLLRISGVGLLEGLLQDNARRMVALPVLNYHVFRHRVNANRRL
jgi:hypothetical protein